MNMKAEDYSQQTSELLGVLGHAFRIQILYEIGKGEACVCHLEGTLNKRQPYISQHLSVLRDAGILTTRREGRYIFYRVSDLGVFKVLEQAAVLQGVAAGDMPDVAPPGTKRGCECPSCESESQPVRV